MPSNPVHIPNPTEESNWHTLAEFSLPSRPGSDRLAVTQIAAAVRGLNLPQPSLERLKTAIGEATLNAIEHGNRYQPDLPVSIRVLVSGKILLVRVTDQAGSPIPPPERPNLAAKVAGYESPRGWGFFLIEKMMDDFRISGDEAHHMIELFLYLEGGGDEYKT